MSNEHKKSENSNKEKEHIKTSAANYSPNAGFGPYHHPAQTLYPGYPFTVFKYYPTYEYVPLYALPEALNLIVQSVSAEREDELFYDYLLSTAPPNQTDIIASIRDDERKHFKLFRELYWELTGRDIPPTPETPFEKPKNYCDGITRALFGELVAVERYRKILFGLEFLPFRNIMTEIYTDELKHASKWNYLFSLNCCCR